MGLRGPQPLSVDELKRRGTYRPSVHAHRNPESATDLCTKPAPRPKTKCGDPLKWVRSIADEKAVAAGCWFDEGLAEYVVNWFRKYLCHSKGRWAGQPFDLLDWQRDDIIYPLFGWLRSGATRRFRRAYIEIPKKNGKSTLASGIGLYMLAGDGENGPEVYSCATDKDQAGIVHGEAINMAEASEALAAVLKVNRTTRNILYDEKRGSYKAVSAKPAGKEGLNGNCWIADELHAWYGDELWNALRYMGTSRTEPLGFAITTAGDDTESVCWKQHEYAEAVLNGTHEGDAAIRFFGYIRGLKRGEDFDTHEARAKANPSLMATMDEGELIADVEEARKSPSAMHSMLRYRFNVWASGSNPWLPLDDWRLCEDEFDEESLAGQTCYGGLDLAMNRDFTSLALFFPYGASAADSYRQLVYFWLPEDTAQNRKHIASYLEWADKGFIRLTPGAVCDYNIVEADLKAISQQFRIQELGYDQKYATRTATFLNEECGVTVVEIPQNPTYLAGPMEEYERLVRCHRLRHNKNPVLTWQAGHVQAARDQKSGKPMRPLKPSGKDDPRTIDGVAAGIMALSRAMLGEGESVYETRGVLRV